MMDTSGLISLLPQDSPFSIVLADLDHTILYLNEAGKRQYAKWGDITGKNLFHCHNENSRRLILEYVERLKAGEGEILFFEDPTHRVYIKSVRGADGLLVGYYEMYAPARAG